MHNKKIPLIMIYMLFYIGLSLVLVSCNDTNPDAGLIKISDEPACNTPIMTASPEVKQTPIPSKLAIPADPTVIPKDTQIVKPKSETNPEATSIVEYGCYQGNISNMGFAAKSGDYIYYAYFVGTKYFRDSNLCKIKQDGSERIKLSDDSPAYINVCGQWIYYSNMSEAHGVVGGKIYKIKTDGTERTKFNDVDSAYINVVNGWIYFVNLTDGGDRHNQRIYKMNVDGTCVTKLNDEMSSHLTVIDNWIYYLEWNFDEEKQIYKKYICKMKTDGTQKSRITDECADLICTDGKLLLFNNFDDGGKLYCINLQDGKKAQLTNEAVKFVNLWGDYIFCIMGNDRIYRMNIDGTNQTIIRDDFSYEINIVGDWIYFYNLPGEGLEGRKMRLDGTMETNF